MYLRAMVPHFFVALPLYVPVAALLVYGYEKYSLVAIGAFLVPVVALQRVIHLYQEQREAALSLAEANASLERANLSFAWHSWRRLMPETATPPVTRRPLRSTRATSPSGSAWTKSFSSAVT